jgi:hypothetical protein
MRHAVWFLPFVTRLLAIGAVLAGLGAGYLESTFGVAFICMDVCPTRAVYCSGFGLAALRLLTPCIVLEAAAFVVFLAYCLATRQARRAGRVLVILLVSGVACVTVLTVLSLHARATLPIWGGDAGDLLREGPLVSWQSDWGAAVTLVALAWSGASGYLQGHR